MTAALEAVEWSAARPGRTLPPGKIRYPFYRRLCGPQGRSGRTENLVPTGIRYRTVQPVVSRYIYITIYYLKSNSGRLVATFILAERLFEVSSNIQPTYWDFTRFGIAFLWWKFPGEIALRANRSLHGDFLGISLSDSPRNAILKTYYTPQFCRILQDQPQYHDVFLPHDYPENWQKHFSMTSMLLFPLHLFGLQMLRPVLTLFFEIQQIHLISF